MMPGPLLALLVVAGLWILTIIILIVLGRKTAAREIVMLLPNLLLLFRGLAKDDRVPRGAKALLWIGIAWMASPIDLIPEFIPVAGPLDDAVVAVIVIRYVVRAAGREVVAQNWRGDGGTLNLILRLAGRHSPA
jgi:uncharacterized membrane protein YkvA (DUF1232 family)